MCIELWTITAARPVAEHLRRELAALGDPYTRFRVEVLPNPDLPTVRLSHPEFGEFEVGAIGTDLRASAMGVVEDVVEQAGEPY